MPKGKVSNKKMGNQYTGQASAFRERQKQLSTQETDGGTAVTIGIGTSRPSKCPKFYTTRISGYKNLRQKERKFCKIFNCYNLPKFLK